MKALPAAALLLALLLPQNAPAQAQANLPGAFGEAPGYRLTGSPGVWTPETMFEHINGEAELLKRYGALSLTYALYESADGSSVSVDLLDMGASVNAFGLFRLYAGCEGEEYLESGATVLAGDFTFYAMRGRHFLRVDAQRADGGEARPLVDAFLRAAAGSLGAPEPLPKAAQVLLSLAPAKCEVAYHPEDVDYDMRAGPGYTWTGQDGSRYFLRIMDSAEEAELFAPVLRDRGAPTVLVWGNGIAWPRERLPGSSAYLKRVLMKTVKW
ncbi:MAG: hypothetical protein JSV00_08435 [bacterium]|nr:MAG: hypothetical protein JSV00_08435 [bacterium]